MTFDEALAIVPEDWVFSHLILLDTGDYQVILKSMKERAVVIGTGDTTTQALGYAALNTTITSKWSSLYVPEDHASPDAPIIRTSIDIAKLFIRKPVEKPRRV